jgi:methionine synthase II (cobalamin-independent)
MKRSTDRILTTHAGSLVWGSMNSPHTQDAPLRNIIGAMFKIKAQVYGVEAANPRHEHEWMVWRDVKLPEGKILIPGLISHATNVVEHPELIAWRIQNYASVVGKENLIAGADCAFRSTGIRSASTRRSSGPNCVPCPRARPSPAAHSGTD